MSGGPQCPAVVADQTKIVGVRALLWSHQQLQRVAMSSCRGWPMAVAELLRQQQWQRETATDSGSSG